MSDPVNDQFKELLNYVKDPEQSMDVNVAELLESYLSKFIQGEVPPNFNSAALLLQGSSNIYGKKVEHLHKLAMTLHESLTKTTKAIETTETDTKKKDPKKKAAKQTTLQYDLLHMSVELKRAKNLSCLTQKKYAKWLPKGDKTKEAKTKEAKCVEKKHAFVPVQLLPREGEEKGDLFYDTRGEPVGYRNDFALNTCTITHDGWLLLEGVSRDILEEDSDKVVSCDKGQDSDHDDDEGYPSSSGCPSTAPPSQDPSSQQSDEGLGASAMATPPEAAASQEEEDLPMDIGGGDAGSEYIKMDLLLPIEEGFVEKKPRRSTRTIVKLDNQVPEHNDDIKDDIIAVKKPIEKLPTVVYTIGMRSNKSNAKTLHPASMYCSRTFFSVDKKMLKRDYFTFYNRAFANNSKFLSQIKKFKDAIIAAQSKKKINAGIIPAEEEVEDVQVADEHSFCINPNLSNDDFAVDNDPMQQLTDENPVAEELPLEDIDVDTPGAAMDDADIPNEEYDEAAQEQMALLQDELQSAEQTEQMGERVRQWQRRVRPFLEEINERERFDINLYGSRILDSFDETNRRQTKVFRDICRGMQKWEIHRYFMALLPLMNTGNVMISNEPRENGEEGEEDIVITLLSRRMHHMELEDFGHGAGEH